jgi:SagB-type dehydrogenase family enzyme
LLTAVFERTSFKYRHDYYLRAVFADAGHVSQSAYLAAAGLGLGACATYTLRHDLGENFLGVDGVGESLIALIVIGRPSK